MSEKPVILFESFPDFSGSTLEVYNELVKRGYDKKYDLIWAVYANFNEKTKYKVIKYFGINNLEKQNIVNRTVAIVDSNRYVQKPKPTVYRINVRHGNCLKETSKYNSKIGPLDCILSTSKQMMECDQRIFPQSIKNKFIVTGYPATDKLFHPHDLYKCGLIKEFTQSDKKFSKIVSWFPTYRQHRGSPRSGSKKVLPYGLPIINSSDEFEGLNYLLNKLNMILLIHPHHAQAKNYTQLENLSNIKFLNETLKLKYDLANTDILGNSDALITDYSAAYHEYVILNRPICLTIDDLVEYSQGCGFFLNYLDWVKGDYVIDINAFIQWFIDISKNRDNSKIERESAMHKIHDLIDDNATKRVVDYFVKNAKL